MRRLASLMLLLAPIACGPAHAWLAQKAATVASGGQVLSSNAITSLPSTGTRYLPIGYSAQPSSTDVPYSVFSAAGTITKFRVKVTTAPTGSATWTFTLRKNGASTSLSCTINSSSSGACTATGSVSYAAGDYGNFQVTQANSPGITVGSISAVFVPTTSGDALLTGRAASFSTSAINAGLPFSDQTPGAIASRNLAYLPDAGTIDKLYVVSTAPGLTGETSRKYDWGISKSATAQTFACTIAADATTCNDTSNSFSATGPSGGTPGDYITFPATPSGTPISATASFAARYRPTTSGSFPLMAVFPSADSAASTMYYPLSGGTAAGSTTEANAQSIADSMTVTKLTVKLNAAPGSGKSRTYTLRVNGADTACTVTISNTATANTASCSVTIADNDLVATSDVPTGTPAAATPSISYLANR